jgi:hypothetical protein
MPKVQVHWVDRDMSRFTLPTHRHDDFIRLWINLLPCDRYRPCAESFEFGMWRQWRDIPDMELNAFLMQLFLHLLHKEPVFAYLFE